MAETYVEPIEILLVEDDPGDALLTVSALRTRKLHNAIHVVRDGVEAMAYLRREAPYEQATRPDLVLLDLNLPRMNGREVLAEVKQDPALRSIPVIVLTTSTRPSDVQDVYDLHGNAYVAKPVHLDRFLEAVKAFEDFFVAVVRLPEAGAGNPPDTRQ